MEEWRKRGEEFMMMTVMISRVDNGDTKRGGWAGIMDKGRGGVQFEGAESEERRGFCCVGDNQCDQMRGGERGGICR